MVEHKFHMTRLSRNIKLGGLPATTSSKSTCPKRCKLKTNGCYGDTGPISLHWNKVSDTARGGTLADHCKDIKSLPRFQLYRMWQVGDFPGDGTLLDKESMESLVAANRGKNPIAYSHYDPKLSHNAELIKFANDSGLTINLSAENLAQADEYVALGIAPVVVILPGDVTENLTTPAGNVVKVCPATISDATCATCAVCANAERKTIIGFPAHSSGKAKVEKVFFMASMKG